MLNNRHLIRIFEKMYSLQRGGGDIFIRLLYLDKEIFNEAFHSFCSFNIDFLIMGNWGNCLSETQNTLFKNVGPVLPEEETLDTSDQLVLHICRVFGVGGFLGTLFTRENGVSTDEFSSNMFTFLACSFCI